MRKTEELVREGKYVRLEENDPSVWCYLREGEKEALLYCELLWRKNRV